MIDYKKKVRLYDPNSGFLDAAVLPLLEPMREVIDQLAEKEKSLEETLKILNPISEKLGGKIAVSDSVILLRAGPHIYRLLGYESSKQTDI